MLLRPSRWLFIVGILSFSLASPGHIPSDRSIRRSGILAAACGLAIVAGVVGRNWRAPADLPPRAANVNPADHLPAPTSGPLSWSEWVTRHAHASPLDAHNRRSVWKFTPEHLRELFKGGDFTVRYEQGIWHLGNSVDSFSYLDMHARLPIQIKGRDRDLAIVKRMQELVDGRAPSELLLIHVGGFHTFEYFIAHPDEPVNYVSQGFTRDVQFGNEKFREFADLVQTNVSQPSYRKTALLGMLNYYRGLEFGVHQDPRLRDFVRLFPGKPRTDSRVVMLGNVHNSAEVDMYESLPTPESLKQAGLTSIKIAYEGLDVRDQPYSFDEVKDYFDAARQLLKKMTPRDRQIFKQRNPRAFEILQSGTAIMDVSEHVLLAAAERYRAAGITVTIVGIER